jgi:hypothetical protein
MDKETRAFIEKMFCNLNKKLDILYSEIKEIKELQLNYTRVSNLAHVLDENKSKANPCGENRKKEEVSMPRKIQLHLIL